MIDPKILETMALPPVPIMKTDPVFDMVFDFNEQVINLPPEPQLALNPLNKKQYEWLFNFVQEEMDEFSEAYSKQDVVGMVDAVLDLCYGALGTLKKMGLTREQAFACMIAVHRANMTKKRGDKGRGSDEDAVKPDDFVPPEDVIGSILFGQPSPTGGRFG